MRILILLFFSILTFGQKLHHQMLSAQGSVAVTAKGLIVSQSIAQQSNIGTFGKGKVMVSQGFQQSKLTAKPATNSSAISTVVYPNPFVDFVSFRFSTPVTGKISISIFDLHGRLLLSKEKEAVGNILTVDNLVLPAGEYAIKLHGNRFYFNTTILKSK